MENLQMIGLGVFVFVLLIILGFLSVYLFKFLKVLSERYLSEKIAFRVNQAIDNLSLIVKNVVDAEIHLYEEEFKKALSDGKVDQKELIDIASKMKDKVLEMIKPDINTLEKYLVGSGLADFVLNMIKGYIKDSVLRKVGASIDPFVSIPNVVIKSSANGVPPLLK